MPLRESLNFGECLDVDLATVFADAAQQRLSRSAEGAAPPTGVLFARVSLLLLQDPLERIIYDPPGLVELGYEAIRRVRWTFNAVPVVLMRRQYRRPLAHPCVGRSPIAGRIGGAVGGFACGLRNKFIFARTGGEQITRTFCGHASLIQVRR